MKRFLVASLLLFPLATFAYVSPGKPLGYVSDFAGMLGPQTVQALDAELKAFEQGSQAQIAVVTVPAIGSDETVETYANKLFAEWGIGKAKQDTGLLLLISRDTREARIEVGYGVEPSVTDIESAHIISDVLAPAFQSGDYDGGVRAAVTRIEEDIKNGEPFVKEDGTGPRLNFNAGWLYPIVIFLSLLGSVLARSKSWWLGGVIGAAAGLVIGLFTGLTGGVVAIVILTPLGLLFDYIVSKRGPGGRGGPPFIFWGGGGGFGRGGGGFGGFGGGSSGGGGASGRW